MHAQFGYRVIDWGNQSSSLALGREGYWGGRDIGEGGILGREYMLIA